MAVKKARAGTLPAWTNPARAREREPFRLSLWPDDPPPIPALVPTPPHRQAQRHFPGPSGRTGGGGFPQPGYGTQRRELRPSTHTNPSRAHARASLRLIRLAASPSADPHDHPNSPDRKAQRHFPGPSRPPGSTGGRGFPPAGLWDPEARAGPWRAKSGDFSKGSEEVGAAQANRATRRPTIGTLTWSISMV